MNLQRLDCAVLGIPFAVDLENIMDERVIPGSAGNLPPALSNVTERTAGQSTRPSLLQDLRKRRPKTAVHSKSLAGECDAVFRDRILIKPADACIDDAVLVHLAAAPADIVIAGLAEEDQRRDELITNPLVPLACPAHFERHADGFVILVRKSGALGHSPDLNSILAAARDGASCLALPVAAAVIDKRQAAELRLRHQRKDSTAQSQMSPDTGMAALQRLTGDKDAALQFGKACNGAQLLPGIIDRSAADAALRTILADEHRRRLGSPGAALIFGSDLELRVGEVLQQDMDMEGHCCIRLAFETTTANVASMHIAVSIKTATGSQCLEQTLQIRSIHGSENVYFQPLRGVHTVALSVASDHADTSIRLMLRSVSLLTPLHLWFENRKL